MYVVHAEADKYTFMAVLESHKSHDAGLNDPVTPCKADMSCGQPTQNAEICCYFPGLFHHFLSFLLNAEAGDFQVAFVTQYFFSW